MTTLISGGGPSGPATALSSLTVAGVPTMGMSGLPLTTGRVIFADYVNGSDGNDGSAGSPVQTLTQAYSLTTAGNQDVVVIISDGTTASTQRLSATLDWAHNSTHLVGMGAPTAIGQRARISTPTTATVNINPLMTVSGNDCIFANFSYFQGVGQSSTAEQLIDISGSRNWFGNVDFGGMGNAAGSSQATSYCIKFTGGDENTFQGCTIGLDTIQRGAANANVVVAASSTGNRFYDCTFLMAAKTDTSPLFVNASAYSGGSAMVFRDCLFLNVNAGLVASTVPAVVATMTANPSGLLVFDKCTMNATKWAAATANGTVIVSGFAVATGFTTGQAVVAADS